MPSQESGKTRAQRIRLDYHQQPDPLNRLRWICVLVAVVAAGAYAVVAMTPGGATQVSPGAVTIHHAAFEHDCAQCHGEGWRSFTAASGDWEAACQACHQATDHFRARLTEQHQEIDQDCRGCHREHQGRMHNLAWVTDKSCQQCHRQLAKVIDAPSPRVRSEIERFSLESHGDFRSLQIDPGEIKFHHEHHLLPGQVPAGARGGFRLDMLPPEWRQRYRKAGQDDNAFVQLACQDCHVPESVQDRALDNAADVDLGRYYAPINFERHCAACHSLNYAGQTEDVLPLPHAVPWREMEIVLTSKLVGGRMTGRVVPIGDSARREPLPGTGSAAASGSSGNVEDDVRRTLLAVRHRCKQCHREEHLSDQAIANARVDGNGLIPSRWLQYGYYDHAAHPGIDCQFCHETVTEKDVADQEHVMIRGIESCTPCHRSTETDSPPVLDGNPHLQSGQPTWAEDRCTLCHRYHWTRRQATSGEGVP